MRIRELTETLARRDPEDIVAIGVYTGNGWYTSAAIAKVNEGDGIILFYTPENDDFVRPVAP
jgi:hypothetical protein